MTKPPYYSRTQAGRMAFDIIIDALLQKAVLNAELGWMLACEAETKQRLAALKS